MTYLVNRKIAHQIGLESIIVNLPDRATWRAAVSRFERANHGRSIFQLANTVLPYLALFVAMYFSLRVSYWLTLALAIPTAGFLTRSFIIFHDCGHNSFFRSRRANRITEFWTGLLSYMPAHCWSHSHALHHASAGDLDHRGSGDIWTLTVGEFRASTRRCRFLYRLYRHPITLFVLGPLFIFLIEYRVWNKGADAKQRRNVIRTNVAIGVALLIIAFTIGLKAFALIQLPVLMFAGAAGVWLFYVHHLSPRIPNYFLQKCHESSEFFRAIEPLTLRSSLRCIKLHLWDEERGRLVGFDAI